jgi:foldase protein PrsA
VGAKPGQSRKSGRQRLALVVFAALFVILVAGFAIAQGIGEPSVPSGDVAIVEGVPDDLGTVSEADFKRGMLQQLASGGLKKLPKPDSKKYEELKTAALGEMLDRIWIQGEAEEMGITATPKQIATELAQIKKQNFPTEAAYQKFLKQSRFTKADVLERVKLQLLSTQVQEAIANSAPPVSSSEISDYYEAEKATQFTTASTRDVRLLVNKDKSKLEQAKALLEKDDSAASWKKVAAKYSTDPTTKTKGGLRPGVTEEPLQEAGPLRSAIFDSATGEVAGPVPYEGTFYVVEVEKLNPEKVQTLAEVRSQISTKLTQEGQEAFFKEFLIPFQSKWTSRTFCASDFTIEKCANYVSSGRNPSAPPTCYEADPKGGPAKECPAPVIQAKPAAPGSATILKPDGERLPQRPRPEGLAEGEAGGLSLPPGVAPGAAGAAPPPEG